MELVTSHNNYGTQVTFIYTLHFIPLVLLGNQYVGEIFHIVLYIIQLLNCMSEVDTENFQCNRNNIIIIVPKNIVSTSVLCIVFWTCTKMGIKLWAY